MPGPWALTSPAKPAPSEINATANFGIAAGAVLGGVVLDAFDARALAWASAIPLALALASSRSFSPRERRLGQLLVDQLDARVRVRVRPTKAMISSGRRTAI